MLLLFPPLPALLSSLLWHRPSLAQPLPLTHPHLRRQISTSIHQSKQPSVSIRTFTSSSPAIFHAPHRLVTTPLTAECEQYTQPCNYVGGSLHLLITSYDIRRMRAQQASRSTGKRKETGGVREPGRETERHESNSNPQQQNSTVGSPPHTTTSYNGDTLRGSGMHQGGIGWPGAKHWDPGTRIVWSGSGSGVWVVVFL